jgi:hypothetical protein
VDGVQGRAWHVHGCADVQLDRDLHGYRHRCVDLDLDRSAWGARRCTLCMRVTLRDSVVRGGGI